MQQLQLQRVANGDFNLLSDPDVAITVLPVLQTRPVSLLTIPQVR
jgi:hypothetical protein